MKPEFTMVKETWKATNPRTGRRRNYKRYTLVRSVTDANSSLRVVRYIGRSNRYSTIVRMRDDMEQNRNLTTARVGQVKTFTEGKVPEVLANTNPDTQCPQEKETKT